MKASEIKVLRAKYTKMPINSDAIIDSSSYVYAPYVSICTKVIVSDKNGTKSYWQINRWMRFKLFVYGLFHKSKKN
jgi:hypothetical protein